MHINQHVYQSHVSVRDLAIQANLICSPCQVNDIKTGTLKTYKNNYWSNIFTQKRHINIQTQTSANKHINIAHKHRWAYVCTDY